MLHSAKCGGIGFKYKTVPDSLLVKKYCYSDKAYCYLALDIPIRHSMFSPEDVPGLSSQIFSKPDNMVV